MSAKSPEGFCYQTQSVVSFRAYESSEKVKLKTRYPFLSADQITGKIRQQWNQLQKSEKKCFIKKYVKLTPVKDKKKKNSPDSNYKTKNESKSYKTKTKRRAKKTDLDVCDTPEYVNTQKLRDFRNQHDEKYCSDFFSTNPNMATKSNSYSNNSQGKPQEELRRNSSPMEDEDDSSDNQFNSSMEEDNQESSDDDNAVLLKRTETGDITDGYNFKDDTDDESDNILIKRDEADYTNITEENYQKMDDIPTPMTNNTATIKRKHTIEHKDSESPCNSKKVKLEHANDKAVSPGSKTDNSHNTTENLEKNSLNTSQDSNSFKSPLMTSSRNVRKTRSKSTPSSSSSVSISAFGPKTLGPNAEIDSEASPSMPSSLGPNTETIDTKSAGSMRSMTPILGQNAEENTKKTPSMSSMTPLTGPHVEKMNAEVTPAVGINLNQEEYYTPLMNEELQLSTLEEAGKAPQKRKTENDDIECSEKIKAAAAGRRVTKSLMPMTDDDKQEIHAKILSQSDTDVKKDKDRDNRTSESEANVRVLENAPVGKLARRKSLRKKSIDNQQNVSQKRKATKGRAGKENKNVSSLKSTSDSDMDDFRIENKLPSSESRTKKTETTKRSNPASKVNKQLNSHMNPSGDACNIDEAKIPEEIEDLKHEQNNELSKTEATHSVLSNMTNAAGEFRVGDSPNYQMGDMCESQASKDSQSSVSLHSQTSRASMEDAQNNSNTTKKQKMNPALLRAIDCLRLTTVTGSNEKETDDWQSQREEDSDSDLSSPRLLSPALSGISELSSLSSSSSQHTNIDNPKASQDSLPRQVTIRSIVGETENDLCKMFADVTPPDRKTKGAFKTQRILQSGNPNRGNFKQLFKDDEDFIFS